MKSLTVLLIGSFLTSEIRMRFCLVALLVGLLVCIFTPPYARLCVMEASAAPFRIYLKHGRTIGPNCMCFSAPSLASLSASSFPWAPECPFTHRNVVTADLALSVAAASRNSPALATPIHPLSSHLWSGTKGGTFTPARTTAYISPV
ncbi:hypothetical protein VTO73DRAFT_15602 [Trametes versicolor]